jgi:hypothetical protein
MPAVGKPLREMTPVSLCDPRITLFLPAGTKPCPSPDVEFCLRGNSRFRAGLGIAPLSPYSLNQEKNKERLTSWIPNWVSANRGRGRL